MAKDLLTLALEEILPSSIANDEQVLAAAKAITPELQSVTKDIRQALILSRIDELPEPVIDALAWQMHVDLYEPTTLSLVTKRELVKNSIPWHRKKGTLWAVKNLLETLGTVPTIHEWFEPDMQTAPHTFSVTCYYKDAPYNHTFLGPDTEGVIRQAVECAKPVRSWLISAHIAPPPRDMSGHICRWDVCRWEHSEGVYHLQWGDLAPDGTEMNGSVETGRDIRRFSKTDHIRSDMWDRTRWDMPRFTGRSSGTGIALTLFLDVGTDDKPRICTPHTWRTSSEWTATQSNRAMNWTTMRQSIDTTEGGYRPYTKHDLDTFYFVSPTGSLMLGKGSTAAAIVSTDGVRALTWNNDGLTWGRRNWRDCISTGIYGAYIQPPVPDLDALDYFTDSEISGGRDIAAFVGLTHTARGRSARRWDRTRAWRGEWSGDELVPQTFTGRYSKPPMPDLDIYEYGTGSEPDSGVITINAFEASVPHDAPHAWTSANAWRDDTWHSALVDTSTLTGRYNEPPVPDINTFSFTGGESVPEYQYQITTSLNANTEYTDEHPLRLKWNASRVWNTDIWRKSSAAAQSADVW